jgi:hypothetical protein
MNRTRPCEINETLQPKQSALAGDRTSHRLLSGAQYMPTCGAGPSLLAVWLLVRIEVVRVTTPS